jgi:DHA3 family macrolide efflux protein-like MFS transporter
MFKSHIMALYIIMREQQAERIPQTNSMTGFIIIFIGQAFSLFGSRLVQFSLVWWLTMESGSASVLAFASIMAVLPQVLLGPFAGTLVDRWDRRIILMVSDGLIALAIVVLAFLFSQKSVQVWHIYVLMAIRSLGGAFQWPAMQSSTSLMVPMKHLSRISGINQSLNGLANIVAPPLGALLLELIPIQNILAIDVSTALFAIGPLFFITVPRPRRETAPEGHTSVMAELKEGFQFIWGWKGLMIIVVIALVINLLTNPAFSLLPIHVTSHFKGGALELAWLQSANGVGMIIGGILLGIWGGFRSRIRTAMLALSITGVSILLFSFLPEGAFVFGVFLLFIFGAMNSIANASFLSFIQARVPAEIQGRVFTLMMSLIMSMTPMGLAFAGPVADRFGVRIWYTLAGIVMIIMSGGAFTIPALMNIEQETPDL